MPGTVTADPAAANAVLDAAIAAGHEGVVVKSLASAYAAGRRGRAWQRSSACTPSTWW
jgi:DNA ligase-1